MNAIKIKKADPDIDGFAIAITPVLGITFKHHGLASAIRLNYVGAAPDGMFKGQLIKWGHRAIGFFTPAARKDRQPTHHHRQLAIGLFKVKSNHAL